LKLGRESKKQKKKTKEKKEQSKIEPFLFGQRVYSKVQNVFSSHDYGR